MSKRVSFGSIDVGGCAGGGCAGVMVCECGDGPITGVVLWGGGVEIGEGSRHRCHTRSGAVEIMV